MKAINQFRSRWIYIVMLDINKYPSRYDCCVEKKILSRNFRQKATQKYFLDNLLPFQYVAIFNSDGMIQIKINVFCKSHVDEVVFLQSQKL